MRVPTVEIGNEQKRVAVVVKAYKSLPSLRRSQVRRAGAVCGKTAGRIRVGQPCAGAMLFSSGMVNVRLGTDDWLYAEIYLWSGQNRIELLEDIAHECDHASEAIVNCAADEGRLRLLARDSRIRKARKMDEAKATITGVLTAEIFQWLVDYKGDADRWCERKPESTSDTFPDDLWRDYKRRMPK